MVTLLVQLTPNKTFLPRGHSYRIPVHRSLESNHVPSFSRTVLRLRPCSHMPYIPLVFPEKDSQPFCSSIKADLLCYAELILAVEYGLERDTAHPISQKDQ